MTDNTLSLTNTPTHHHQYNTTIPNKHFHQTKSYYGESKLHYLPADASRADAAAAVPLPKDGPVHDVQWSPQGDFFVAVAGFMPSKVR